MLRVDDITTFKDDNNMQSRALTKIERGDNIEIHVE